MGRGRRPNFNARQEILEVLTTSGALTWGEIGDKLGIGKNTLSTRLNELLIEGKIKKITDENEGNKTKYIITNIGITSILTRNLSEVLSNIKEYNHDDFEMIFPFDFILYTSLNLGKSDKKRS